MKKRIIYLITVGIIVVCLWVLAAKVGVSTIEVNCSPMAMDCGNGSHYSPLFWFPMRFVRSPLLSDPYSVAAWPGLGEDAWPVFVSSLLYWFIIANIVVFPLYKLLLSKGKTTS